MQVFQIPQVAPRSSDLAVAEIRGNAPPQAQAPSPVRRCPDAAFTAPFQTTGQTDGAVWSHTTQQVEKSA